MIASILKRKHSRECHAIQYVAEGTWESVWTLPELTWAGKTAKRGKRNGVAWIKFRCNCGHCSAELWVREADILALLPKS